jgi:c-di-GMP-related signal transduction protein
MTEPALQNAFLFRQPILNRQEELAGYQLSFGSGDESAAACSRTGSGATAALCAAYSELGMQSALGNSCAFIDIDSRLPAGKEPSSCCRRPASSSN